MQKNLPGTDHLEQATPVWGWDVLRNSVWGNTHPNSWTPGYVFNFEGNPYTVIHNDGKYLITLFGNRRKVFKYA